jgi:hypothetical protein
MAKKKPKVKITDCTQERDMIEVNSRGTKAPAPDWRFVDAKGVTHKWVDGELPTLEQRSTGVYYCDACDEEHEDFEWFVPATGEVVTPGYIPRLACRTLIPGPISISGTFAHLSGKVVPGDVLTAAECGLSEGDGGSIRIASIDARGIGEWDAVAPGWGM